MQPTNFAAWLMACDTAVKLHTTTILQQEQTDSQRSRQPGNAFHFKRHAVHRPGDPRRSIDWKASRKAHTLLSRQFEHEARLDVMAICDISPSMCFGYDLPKLRLALDCAGILGLAALHQGHAFGLMTFAANVVSHISPRRHKGAIVHALADLWNLAQRSAPTDGTRLRPILRVLAPRQPMLTCLVSDFRMPDWQPVLRALRARHDLMAVLVEDTAETCMANRGYIALRDIEQGRFMYLDTASETVRRHYQEQAEKERTMRLNDLKHICGNTSLVTTAPPDYKSNLVRLFLTHSMRQRV